MGMITKRTDSGGGERLFFYTADDERFWSYHSSGSRWTLRDLDGKVLRDYRSGVGGWSVERDYVYADGKLLAATKPGTSTVYHYHLDHLGTPRLITNQNGSKLAYHAYLPYGEEATYWNQDTETMKFTGHERDFYDYGAADDLDYQHARYYNPQLGRYLSVDFQSGNSSQPQSWNRFSYGRANPIKYVDPTGEYVVSCASGAATCQKNATDFEAARQTALMNKDTEIKQSALAYGDPGVDDGVMLTFGDPGKGFDAKVVSDALWSDTKNSVVLSATVTVRPGLPSATLFEKVVHEGQHLVDAHTFVETVHNDGTYDSSKNLTIEQTETNAYRLSQRVWDQAGKTVNYGCKGCDLGARMRPGDVNRSIKNILNGSQYRQNLGKKQFSRW